MWNCIKGYLLGELFSDDGIVDEYTPRLSEQLIHRVLAGAGNRLVGRAQRQLDAAHRILDMNEGARLATGAVDGERVADRGLDQEPVQHRAVITVVIKAIG